MKHAFALALLCVGTLAMPGRAGYEQPGFIDRPGVRRAIEHCRPNESLGKVG